MNKKEFTKAEMIDFIESIAVLKPSTTPGIEGPLYWASKTDGSYLTYENLFMDLQWMKRLGITEQIQSHNNDGSVASLGFNPVEQKWYGWSHRAVFGFGIGSTCKKGDCGYVPDNEENFIEDQVNFWKDEEYHEGLFIERVTDKKGRNGIRMNWRYTNTVPNESLRGKIDDRFIPFPEKYGRGEWEAKTLEDAKQMAIDFAESVG